MNIAAAKEKLHQLIEQADEKKVLLLLTLIEGSGGQKSYTYDEETLQMLRERSAEYSSGKSQTFTPEDSMERIKKHRSENGV
jgi:hypothetical protein